MKRTLTCPACGGGHILAVRQINEAAHNGVKPLALGTEVSFWGFTHGGDPLYAYVCKACLLVELRVHAIDHLEPDGENVIELVRPQQAVPRDAPYR